MDNQITEFFDEHENELVEDVFTVCRVNSERGEAEDGAPFGAGPRQALAEAEKIAKKWGLDAEVRGDRVMYAEYGEGEPALAILAHLDVVPAGTGWTSTEPYNPVRRDDVLYGRGVADDKGPAMASLFALRCVKELGVSLGKKVQLILGSCEETGSQDVRWYREHYSMPPMVFTPDGDFPVVNTEKGRTPITVTCPPCEHAKGAEIVSIKGGTVSNAVPGEAEAVVRFVSKEQANAAISFCSFGGVMFEVEELNSLDFKFTCKGTAAHASTPEEGDNAICGLLHLLMLIPMAESSGHDALLALNDAIPYGDVKGETFGGSCADEESGALTVNLGTIDYSPETGLRAEIDMRVPVCGDSNAIHDALQAALGDRATAEMRFFSPPHQVPSSSDFVKGLLKIYEDYTGTHGEPISIGGGTYVHHIDGGVAFGCSFPGRKPRMHEPDENMSVSDLKLAGSMFAQAVCDFCK